MRSSNDNNHQQHALVLVDGSSHQQALVLVDNSSHQPSPKVPWDSHQFWQVLWFLSVRTQGSSSCDLDLNWLLPFQLELGLGPDRGTSFYEYSKLYFI
jgi:hypothetical protein